MDLFSSFAQFILMCVSKGVPHFHQERSRQLLSSGPLYQCPQNTPLVILIGSPRWGDGARPGLPQRAQLAPADE